MVANDVTVLRLRHNIFYEVTKAVWEGSLDKRREQVPYSMVPGLQTIYRCYIYKEREIVWQKVRLTEGKCPAGKNTSNVAQIINVAREECPIASCMVVDDCRKCMEKACQDSCSFGVINMGHERAYIELSKCKEYSKCSQACPYNAIAHLGRPCEKVCPVDAIAYDEYNTCVTGRRKCVQCGTCIHGCPSKAIESRTFIVDVVRLIKTGKRVVITVTLATEEQSGPNITMASWKTASRQLGFADTIEVGLGGDITAAYEAEEQAQAHKEGKKMATSYCPAFADVIKQHFPMSLENMSITVPPMCAVPRTIKNRDPGTVTVSIGPCIAKKGENLGLNIEGNADYVVTFDRMRAIIRAKGIESQPAENDYQESFVFGKCFGNGGDVTAAILGCLKETGEDTDVKAARCDGAIECKKASLLMKMGKLPKDLMEGMAYIDDCIGGSNRHRTRAEAKEVREQLVGSTGEGYVLGNLKKHPMDEFPVHRY